MIETDRDLIHSESVKAGKRIYYFDVKQSRNGDRYLAITESKKIVTGPEENPTVTFEKHKVFLYREDFEKFQDALVRAIAAARSGAKEYTPAHVSDYAPAPAETPVVATEPEEPRQENDDEIATAMSDLN